MAIDRVVIDQSPRLERWAHPVTALRSSASSITPRCASAELPPSASGCT